MIEVRRAKTGAAPARQLGLNPIPRLDSNDRAVLTEEVLITVASLADVDPIIQQVGETTVAPGDASAVAAVPGRTYLGRPTITVGRHSLSGEYCEITAARLDVGRGQ